MENPTKPPRNHRLAIGFLAGAAVGAGLVLWLAPRAASELKQRAADRVKDLRKQATDRYTEARVRVDKALDELTRKGQAVRDEAADTVVRGAREVERRAAAAKTDHVA